MKKIILSFLFLTTVLFEIQAQSITDGHWYNDTKVSKVQFYESGGKIYGKIIWLKEPTLNGKPKVDEKNPDTKLRNTPLMGLVFLKGFVEKGTNKWEDGKIYDPRNGKTYSCEITKVGNNKLNVRGYIGFSLLGSNSEFTRAE